MKGSTQFFGYISYNASGASELKPLPEKPWIFSNQKMALWGTGSLYESSDLVLYTHGTIANADKDKIKETIAKLYAQYGSRFYEHLDGLHFVLLYDKNKNALFLCNNRYQTTQLYYFIKEGVLYFSKHLLHFIKLGVLQPQAHFPSIRSFVSNGFTISDQTQIQGVKKLLPTFQLEITESALKTHNHWKSEITFNREGFSNLESKLNEYENLYQNHLSNFIQKNKAQQVGTLLSGGHDTSWVVIQCNKIKLPKPLQAYTITFPGWNFNEEGYAQNIAEKFNAIFNPIPFSGKNLDLVVDLVRSNEEPVVGSSLPLHLLGGLASQTCDLMLGGDGGDTLWGEYFPVAEVHRYLHRLPVSGRKWIHQISRWLAQTVDWERLWELEHVLSLFKEKDFYDDFMRKLCTYRHFNDENQKQLFTSEIYNNFPPDRSAHEVKFTKENFSDALIEGKLFNAFYTYQSFHTTKSMEHHGMELYLPTIQKDIIRFITELPNHWVNGGTTFHRLINSKSINRRFHKMALARYLKREEIYNRSFDIPWSLVFKDRPEVLRLLQSRLIKRGWYNSQYIHQLFDEFKAQKLKDYELLELKNHGYRIFTLLSLEVWAMEFLDGGILKNLDLKHLNLEDYLSAN